jgi:hypothetical protein
MITTAAGGALAASHGHDHDGDHHRDFREPLKTADNWQDLDDTYVDQGGILPEPGAVRIYQPRLQTILSELRTDNMHINADRQHGLLTAANYRDLRSEDARIRHEAMAVAAWHHGTIPSPRFVTLQNEVQHLGRDVQRMI